MAVGAKREQYVDVVCPVCLLPRTIVAKQAKRIAKGLADGRCRSCRNPRVLLPPDNEDRRFWLRRFDDQEIAVMAEAFYGRGSIEAVARWRARLAGTGNGKPE